MGLLHSIKKAIIKKIIKNLLHRLKERSMAKKAGAEGSAPAPETVLAPVGGTVIPMSDIPDDIFGQNDIGKGCGIWPDGGKLISPISGTVYSVAVGAHTAVILSDGGAQVLVHMSSSENDTGEKSAQLLVESEQPIKAGDELMTFEPKPDMQEAHDQFAIIAVLNTADYTDVELLHQGEIEAGQQMLKIQ